MKLIENKIFPQERDLYGEKDILLRNCIFKARKTANRRSRKPKTSDSKSAAWR